MSPFAQIALAIVAAASFGVIAKLLRQPLMLGYLVAGFAIIATGLVQIDDPELLSSLGKIGVAFLLFLVGLEMNFAELRSIGKVAIATGLGQIAFTSIIGYFIAQALGFSPIASLYIAIALTFSSTIIAIKLLSEKKDLGSLYGKITVGFLLVQDFVAILVLIFLAGFRDADPNPMTFGLVILKGIILVGLVLFLSRKVLPKIFDRIAVSGELLFITSIAWALGISALMQSRYLGFSIEIGGFVAGLALANSVGHLQITSRVKPLRDFFITIFFLVLGMELVLTGIGDLIVPIIIFSLLVFIGNPLIVMFIMGIMGYHRRTSFLASVTVAQVFEFSFIVMAMGLSLGHITNNEVAIVTVVGVVTMLASTYLIMKNHQIYAKIERYLKFFERGRTKESAFSTKKEYKGHIVLIGCDRTGKSLLPHFKKSDDKLLILDFNPSVVEHLLRDGHDAIYGDISDAETVSLLGLENAKLIISTVDNQEDNLIILENIKNASPKPISIFIATSPHEALIFYENGADYVIVPQTVGGEHLGHIISSHGVDRDYFKKLRERHFDRLAKERF